MLSDSADWLQQLSLVVFFIDLERALFIVKFLRPFEGAIVEAALGQTILIFVFGLADDVVDSVVDQSFHSFTSFDPVQSHFYVRDGFTSGVLAGSLVKLS